jgi:hypothetical protein
VPHYIVQDSVGSHSAQINFADSVSDAIARIAGAVRVAGVRRRGHPDSQKPYRCWAATQANRLRSTLCTSQFAEGKRLPDAARRGMHGLFGSGPVLHHKIGRVGIGPRDANAVDRLILLKISHNPLRVRRVALAGPSLGEVWIALPISVEITIGQT